MCSYNTFQEQINGGWGWGWSNPSIAWCRVFKIPVSNTINGRGATVEPDGEGVSVLMGKGVLVYSVLCKME